MLYSSKSKTGVMGLYPRAMHGVFAARTLYVLPLSCVGFAPVLFMPTIVCTVECQALSLPLKSFAVGQPSYFPGGFLCRCHLLFSCHTGFY